MDDHPDRLDRLDRTLRTIGQTARFEVEAGLDVDAELAALHGAAPAHLPTRTNADEPAGRPYVWLAVAAAAVLAIAGGVLLLRSDDSVEIAEPATTVTTTDVGTAAPTAPTAPPTTAPVDIGQLRSGAALPGGRFDARTGDLVEVRADGTLWLRRDFATDPTDDGVRLLDLQGRYALDGTDGVAVVLGALWWSNCCEPLGGTIWATTEIDGERQPIGDGSLLRVSPDGSIRATVRPNGGIELLDLRRGSQTVVALDDVTDLQWTADSRSLLVLHWDENGWYLSQIESTDDFVSATIALGIDPPTASSLSPHFAGIDASAAVVATTGTDQVLRFFRPTSLDELTDGGAAFSLPSDARSVQFAPDGTSLVYVADDGLHRVDDEGVDTLVADDVVRAWFPTVVDPSAEAPSETTVPDTTVLDPTIPDTTIPPTTVPSTTSIDWRELTWESSGITSSCVRASLICTRVIHDPDGTPVSYDPATRQLTRHGVPAVTATLPESYGAQPWLYHAGPDGVVYLQVDAAVPAELAADLVAVTLSAGDAGRELGRWSDAVDAVGDSELVATPDGLVNVNCCGPDPIRPAPDAPVVVQWLDRSGTETVADGPSIRVVLDGTALTVQRTDTVPAGTREWTFTPADEPFLRGMPQVTATFDGGFVAALPTSTGTTIVRGWTNGDVEQVTLADVLSVALDRNGRFLVDDGTRIVRVEPFPDRTLRPSASPSVDVAAGTVTLPDLADVDAPWFTDPVAFADAVRGPLAANEQRTIDAEQRSATDWLVAVTTSNFFDDSIFADRWELALRRDADGRFAFVSGSWSQACQPARGQQDFRAELCV